MDFSEQLRQTKQEVLDAQKQKVHTEGGFPTTIESIFKDACSTGEMSDDEFIKNAILTHYRTLLEDGELDPDATSFTFDFTITINGSLLKVEKKDDTIEQYYTVESISLVTNPNHSYGTIVCCSKKEIEPFRIRLTADTMVHFMWNEVHKFSEVVLARLNECGIKASSINNLDDVQILDWNNYSSFGLRVFFRCSL